MKNDTNATPRSLDVLVRGLPDEVKNHVSDIQAENDELKIESEPLVVVHLAWRRWARGKTCEELHRLLMGLRNRLYHPDDSAGAIILEESAWRLWRPPQTKSTKGVKS